MKTNVFFATLLIVSLSIASCSDDQIREELTEIEQLENLNNTSIDAKAIDKDEFEEDDI